MATTKTFHKRQRSYTSYRTTPHIVHIHRVVVVKSSTFTYYIVLLFYRTRQCQSHFIWLKLSCQCFFMHTHATTHNMFYFKTKLYYSFKWVWDQWQKRESISVSLSSPSFASVYAFVAAIERNDEEKEWKQRKNANWQWQGTRNLMTCCGVEFEENVG